MPRQSFISQDDELQFSDDFLASAASSSNSKSKKPSASEQVQVLLEFPGNEFKRPSKKSGKSSIKLLALWLSSSIKISLQVHRIYARFTLPLLPIYVS